MATTDRAPSATESAQPHYVPSTQPKVIVNASSARPHPIIIPPFTTHSAIRCRLGLMVGLQEFTRLTRKAKVSPDAHYNPLVHSTLMRSWLTLHGSIIVGVVGWASAQRSSQKESRGSTLVRVGISQLAASYSDRPVCLAHPFLTVIAFHTFVSNPHGMMHIALGTVEVARSRVSLASLRNAHFGQKTVKPE